MEPFDEGQQEEFMRKLHIDNLRKEQLRRLLESDDEEGEWPCEMQ